MQKTIQTYLNDGNPTDIPMRLGQLNFGDFLASFAKGGEIDAADRTVTTNVHVFADSNAVEQYGVILSVVSTAGTTTGPFTKVFAGTPTTGQVKVTMSDGRPTLTFAVADAVTACRCHWIAVPKTRDGLTWLAKLAEVVA